MDKYLEAEKRLAGLLGYREIEDSIIHRYMYIFIGLWGNMEKRKQHIHRWCRDDAAAFQLMVEHGVFPVELRNKGMVTGYAFMHPIYVKVSLADHPDKAAAVRYAIVMAVIAKLESAS